MSADRYFMKQAVALARRRSGATSPNPPVGAVLVGGGEVIGRGYHLGAGHPHAEVEAIRSVVNPERLPGATLYVTLEPCNHHGRTPPCTEAILAAGIIRVVIGARDPNPTVTGSGAEFLVRAGLQVEIGCLQEEAEFLIRAWTSSVTGNGPWITAVLGLSLTGAFVTHPESLAPVHLQLFRRWSSRCDAYHATVDLGGRRVSESQLARYLDAPETFPQHFGIIGPSEVFHTFLLKQRISELVLLRTAGGQVPSSQNHSSLDHSSLNNSADHIWGALSSLQLTPWKSWSVRNAIVSQYLCSPLAAPARGS